MDRTVIYRRWCAAIERAERDGCRVSQTAIEDLARAVVDSLRATTEISTAQFSLALEASYDALASYDIMMDEPLPGYLPGLRATAIRTLVIMRRQTELEKQIMGAYL